ncbi:MAG: (2Fe-2S) ferredoxin domain-containing protein [Myxococcota bacterium]
MPHFKRHVLVCTNARPAGNPRGSCAEKGADEVLAAMKASMRKHGLKADFRANKSGCLDTCEQGISIVVYPEAVWYQKVTLEDVEELVTEHLVHGRVVERLVLPPQTPALEV